MLLGRVEGTVVCTEKHQSLHAEKLLCVRPLDEMGDDLGELIVAVDRAQAGIGDQVLLMREGSGCRQIIGRDQGLTVDKAVKEAVPVRSMIVGIVDRVFVP
ncbi:MAG: EutN/CcmL family microcompartment protein [Deltaproteobacteria bacterium]|nr:EutN/CcmL family microcompartment protein [Deltaproteobacteria bacterium]